VGIPAAISAVQALIKFRGRVDQILALKEASEAIPFSLPPAPFDFTSQQGALFRYFDSDAGRLVIEVHGRREAYQELKADPLSGATFKLRIEFLQLFFEASDTAPVVLGPQSEARSVRASAEMRLTYYVVASHRLSRNPALTRILLATADTVLEVAGANAGLFISNPKTQAIVATLLTEFAGKRDFDDDGAEMLLRGLLRAAVVSAMENQAAITDTPALVALFGALADMREQHGDDFVARILTRPGFQSLVGHYLTEVAEDPSFLVEDGPFRVVLSDTLRDLGENFEQIFEDPKALFGVLETALTSATGQAREIIALKIGGQPLLSAVLQSVLAEIETRGKNDALFASFANGEIVSGVFRASLSAIAANPGALAKAVKISELSAALVAGMADVLSKQALADVVSAETLRDIASRSFLVLAENSASFAGNSEFVVKLTAGVLNAAASAVSDGLSTDDLLDLLDAAVVTSTANLGLLKLDVRLEGVLDMVGAQLSEKGVRALLAPESRVDVVLATLETVARSPKVWSGFAEADLVQPLVVAVFQGLATDKTALLTGPVMVEGIRAVLTAATLRGQALIEELVTAEDLQKLLTLGLRKLDQEIGRGVDAETVPEYLRRLTDLFLTDPFEIAAISGMDFKNAHELAMGRTEPPETGGTV
jgi:hypothetical protein